MYKIHHETLYVQCCTSGINAHSVFELSSTAVKFLFLPATHGLFCLCIRPACSPRPLSGGEGEEVHMLELRFLYTTDQLYVPEKLGQRTDVYKTSIKYKRLS